jgi:transcriptional regulator GlxA family with amidase domain
MSRKRVGILIFPDVEVLDFCGPFEVFSVTRLNEELRREEPSPFEVLVVAEQAGTVTTTGGMKVTPHHTIDTCPPLDILVVPGGWGTRAEIKNTRLVEWIKARAAQVETLTSVCTGSMLLGQAGLLDGRHATTHWASCADLAERYPAVTVEPDPIFVRDGNVATSAGVTAGMDLALALVEEDLGRDTALEAARWLVLFLKRPGGQAQFSAQLAAQTADRAPLRELQAWIPDHLGEDLSVPALARRAQMSDRNFARAFRRETGMTPAAYVEAARVESARIALESGELPVESVARQAGFGTVETLRRAFRRRVGVSPVDYRSRFRRHAA